MNLSLIVLWVSDLKESRRFYSLLGLDLQQEQHGDGAVHYSATIHGRTVIELYPAGDRPPSRVRLGFEVPDPAAVAERLRKARFTVKRESLVIDPDGNRVEIREEEG